MFCSSSLENSKTSCCCKSSMSTRSRLGSLTNLHALLDRNSTRGARRRQLRSFRVQPPLLRGSCNREINNFNSCNISASTLLVSRRSRSQLGFQFSRSQNNIHVSSAPRLQRSRRLGARCSASYNPCTVRRINFTVTTGAEQETTAVELQNFSAGTIASSPSTNGRSLVVPLAFH